MMRFGVAFPTGMEGLCYNPPFITSPEVFVRWAKEAERLGFEGVWPNDHFHTQRYVAQAFPDPPRYFDPLLVMAYIARETTRLRFCTGILVLPMRDPIVLAKQVMTLDHLSGGRVTLGLGLGAYREEYDACRGHPRGMPRGALLDEGLAALEVLFSQRLSTFHGRHVRFEGVEMYPKPVQHPLPIYIGGNNTRVLERVVKYGHGWYGACLTPQEIQERLDIIRSHARTAGRDIANLDIAPQFIVSIAKTHEEAVRRFRASHLYKHLESLRASTFSEQAGGTFEERNMVGSPDDLIERMHEYLRVGVTSFPGSVFLGDSPEEVFAAMELYATQVMPAFR